MISFVKRQKRSSAVSGYLTVLWYSFCARSEDRATLESDPSAVRVVKRLGVVCRLRAPYYARFSFRPAGNLQRDKLTGLDGYDLGPSQLFLGAEAGHARPDIHLPYWAV